MTTVNILRLAQQDLRDLIRTYRNNPSVVMSIGNEIQEQADKVNGGQM